MATLTGTCPILTTPYTDQKDVDFEGLRRVIRFHVEGGCSAIVLFGLASEEYKLTDAERDRIGEVAVDECRGTSTAVVYTVTDHATSVAVERAQEADTIGTDVIMVLPPYYLKPSFGDVRSHVRRVSDAVSRPVAVQYAPGPTGVTRSPAELAELATEIGDIEYFKIESPLTGQFISELLDRTDGDVNAWSGNAGRQMINVLDRGAVGVMPGSPFFDVYEKIYERYESGDREAAIDLLNQLLPLLNHITQTPEMAFYYGKRILRRRGIIDSAAIRAPTYTPDDEDDKLFERHYETVQPRLNSPLQS